MAAPDGGWFRTRQGRWALPALLLAGLLVREAFSFWTGHPYDFEIWIRTGYVVAHGTDPYTSFWPPVPGLSISYLNTNLTSASYLPFWPMYNGAAYQGYVAFGGGNRFVYYFLLKQGPIAGDVLTAGLLYRVVARFSGDRGRALRAAAFWSFFPYAIVISALWGQFDSLAVAVVVASLLVAEAPQKNLLYGVGIFVKWITAMFLPFEFFRRRGTARLWVLGSLAVPLALTAVVFLTLHWGSSGVGGHAAMESGGVGGGMNWARWLGPYGPLAALGSPPLATDFFEGLWVPGVVLAGWLSARNLAGRGWAGEVDAVVGIVATFLLLRWGLNEQYLLYLFAPLLVDLLVFHPERRPLSATIVALCTLYLVVKNTLLVPFAAPLGPQYVAWVNAANNAPEWDPLRLWTLNGLAILITICLAQLAYVVLARRTSARPWLLEPVRVVRHRVGRPISHVPRDPGPRPDPDDRAPTSVDRNERSRLLDGPPRSPETHPDLSGAGPRRSAPSATKG